MCCLLVSPARAETALRVAGRTNATPNVAAHGRFVAVAWGGAMPDGTTDVFVAVSRDGGTRFGTPVRVNDVAGDARLNGEQPPQVALIARTDREPSIVVVWTTKGPNGTVLKQSRSEDGGQTFSAAAAVPGSEAAGNRGWEAIAVEPGGRVDAVWLDHREMAADLSSSHHEHSAASGSKPDGVAMAQKSKLFFASLDGAVGAAPITGGVCYCCKTALAAGASGAVYAAWRHVYPGNIRDMAFAMSHDGGRSFERPIRVSEDKWMLEGCPDDGPSMAVDTRGRIHVVWPTLVEDKTAAGEVADGIAIFYAWSDDGRQFSPRQRIPTEGTPHHPRVAVTPSGELTIVWDEVVAGKRAIAIARAASGEHGSPQFHRARLSAPGTNVYPALASAGEQVVTVWATGSGSESAIHVHTVRPVGEAP
jgi:hypothetical protein